jgi:hypothetical protein
MKVLLRFAQASLELTAVETGEEHSDCQQYSAFPPIVAMVLKL